MASTRWTDTFLDEMSRQGDPLADQAVAEVYAEGPRDLSRINALLRHLMTNDELVPEQFPPRLQDYFLQSAILPDMDPHKLRLGEAVFAQHGLEIMMILGCCSLPLSYAASRGVRVIYDTGYLLNRATQRLFETGQMVVDMLSPGGMHPSGRAIRTAQKIRLMHAAVRFLLTHNPHKPWDPSLGTPINQEDLAGTFTVFTVVVVKYGLSRLGIQLTLEEQEAYLHAWQIMASAMGLDPRVVPHSIAETDELASTIQRRQFAASEQGRALTAALIQSMQALLPTLFRDVPAVFIRHFLSKDPYQGTDIADLIGVPHGPLMDLELELLLDLEQGLELLEEESGLMRKLLRKASLHLLEAMLGMERGGNRPAFYIPPSVRANWLGRDSQVA